MRQAPSTVPMGKPPWKRPLYPLGQPLCEHTAPSLWAESRPSSPLTLFLSLVSFPWDPGWEDMGFHGPAPWSPLGSLVPRSLSSGRFLPQFPRVLLEPLTAVPLPEGLNFSPPLCPCGQYMTFLDSRWPPRLSLSLSLCIPLNILPRL